MDGPIQLKILQPQPLLLLVSFVAIVLVVTSASAQNTPPDVINVTLDKEVVYAWCDLKVKTSGNEECPENGVRVKVSASAQDRENNPLIYIYKVTGGRILGQGSNVFWDLTKERAGEYSITVSADDGGGTKGKQITKTIKLEECPDCDPGCECPSIDIRPAARFVLPGERIGLEALVTGEQQGITYNWTASNGQIVNGQGTPGISVRSDKSAIGKYLHVKLEIGGTNPGCNCPKTVEESIFVGNQAPEKKPSPEITELDLDRTEIFTPCEPGRRTSPGCRGGSIIRVSEKTTAMDAKVVSYRYRVSGGRIIGQGPTVEWDLGDVPNGTYTIRANVADGDEFHGSDLAKVVTVVDCPDCGCGFIDCPSISVIGPRSPAEAGDSIVFTASISGGSQDATYHWSVSRGSIIEGQGTPSIKVATTAEMAGTEVTATVEIGSEDDILRRGLCITQASEKSPVLRKRIRKL